MLPRYIVGRDIELGRLEVIMEQYGIAPLEIYAVYPHRKYLSAKVRSFLEFIQGWLPHRIGMDPP
jgi:DNA-binding transcriptional LysR family regulator